MCFLTFKILPVALQLHPLACRFNQEVPHLQKEIFFEIWFCQFLDGKGKRFSSKFDFKAIAGHHQLKCQFDPNMISKLFSPAPPNSVGHCSSADHSEVQWPPELTIWWPILNKMGNLQGKAEGVWEGVWVSDNEGAGILGFQQVDRVLPGDVGLVPPLVILLHL